MLGANGVNPGPVTQLVSYPSGRWISFTLSSNKISRAEDNMDRTVEYTYEGSAPSLRLKTVTDANQVGQPTPKTTTYTWMSVAGCDPSNVITAIKDPRDITWLSNTFGTGCRVSQQTAPTATGTETWDFAYTVDGQGRVTQTEVTDPNEVTRRVMFDANGYLATDTAAMGTPSERTLTYERGTDHLASAVVDSFHSRRTESTFDAFGDVLSTTRLAGTAEAVTTSYTYAPEFHQLATITDPLNHTTTFAYDASGCLDSVTDAADRTSTVDCNGAGQVTSVTDPLSHTTSFGYSHGDLVPVTDPLGRTSTRFLDGGGRTLEATNPLNETTSYAFDNLNQMTQITDSIGGQIGFVYDPDGNLLEVNDNRRGTLSRTSFAYNNLNLPSSRTDPLGRAETFTYDDEGNLTFWTDRRNQVTEFRYDPLDQLTFAGFKRTVGGGGNPNYESTVTYTWDGGSRLTQIADSTTNAGTITRTYDDLDRLTNEKQVNASNQGVTYTYNPDGTRATMTVQSQTQVVYGYNNAAQLTSLVQGSVAVGLDYLGDGRLRQVTLPSSPALTQTYTYDDAGQIASIAYQRGANPPDDLVYTYDRAGRRSAVSGSYARTGLPAVTTANAVYDLANQLTSWNGAAVTNDLSGNLTTQGGLTYAYNARNQLTSVKQGNTTLGAFVHDGLGRRARRTISGAVTRPVYDGWNVVQERSSNGNQVTANLLVGLGLDDVFVRTDTSQREFLTDALGSTVALADTSGVVQTSYTYEPFGKTTISGGSSSSAYQFTGRENDSTGALSLYNLRARYYSPTPGRFLTEDPIGFAGGDANLYAYVGNAPTIDTDPMGLFDWPPIIGPTGFGWIMTDGSRVTAGWIRDRVIDFQAGLRDWWSGAWKDLQRLARAGRDWFNDFIDERHCLPGTDLCGVRYRLFQGYQCVQSGLVGASLDRSSQQEAQPAGSQLDASQG